MAHMIETAFYAKQPAWHGLGTVVDEALTSDDALRIAKLDWDVISEPLFLQDGIEIEDRVANVRATDRKVLGVTSKSYKIVQNRDAFAFVDKLLDCENVRFESAGSLDGGKKVWMLAHLPAHKILGDDVVPYLVFANSHNCSMAVTVAMTPTRVVCQNTLTLALSEAKRSWSIRHIGSIENKMEEASRTLQLANKYMERMNERAEVLQQVKLSAKDISSIIEYTLPIKDEESNNAKKIFAQRNELFDLYSSARDLKKFEGTAWGLYNAVGDFVSHITPLRKTKTYQEKLFESFIDGNAILDRAQEAIEKVA